MTKLLFIISILPFGAASFFYYQQEVLQEKILENRGNCRAQATELEKSYLMLIEELMNSFPEGTTLTKTVEIRSKLAPPKLEEMVSYSHQVKAVVNKFEFILDTAEISPDEKQLLRRLLMQREQLAGRVQQASIEGVSDMGDLEEKLEKTEEKIKHLLKDPVDYTRYEYLRERSL